STGQHNGILGLQMDPRQWIFRFWLYQMLHTELRLNDQLALRLLQDTLGIFLGYKCMANGSSGLAVTN
ncbi:Hypothetical protein FKW44_014594, partial [Caligus rogercresseyi]